MTFGKCLCLMRILNVVSASLNPIIIKGNAFFDSVTNERFYVRGVDYQVPPPPVWRSSMRLTSSLVDRLLSTMIL